MKKARFDVEATLCFPLRGECVLMARKKDGIGKGRYNGYGGKKEKGDFSIRATAAREIKEEGNVLVRKRDFKKVAIGYFTNIKSDGSKIIFKVHIYIIKKWKGEFRESNEMGIPHWFYEDEIPFDEMMAGDQPWIREILKGKKIIVRATLKNKQQELVGRVKIIYVKSFE